MKKIIAMLLVLTLALGLFAGCKGEEGNGTTGAAGSVEDAKAYLAAMYKEAPEAVLRDFERVAVVSIGGVKYSVTWTADVAEDLVKITATDTMATIDINEKPAEDFTFTLTATLKGADGKTATVTFKHSVAAPASTGTLFVENPEVGVPYKWALQQNGLDGQPVLYFTGEKAGNYLATSENPLDAVDVVIEETEGGYYLTFMQGEAKKYIIISTYEKDDGSLGKTQDISDTPSNVYTWDAERGTMISYIEALGESFYLGTYGTYNTISTSATSYIEDVTKIGVSQFPTGFCTISAEIAETPVPGTAYVWGLQQNGLDTPATLYFTGEKAGNYLATSTNIGDAVRVYLEETEGGYHLFFLQGGAKKYINITTYEKDDGSLSKTQDIGNEPTCVYTWDAERGTMIAFIEALGESFYLGTYGTYNTISTSATSYIEDVTKIGVSQFPAVFYDLGLPAEEMPDPNAPSVDLTTPAGIVDAAYALKPNEALEGEFTLTGKIISIDSEWSEQYGNITVTIAVEGKEDKPIQAFRLKGNGADKLAVGDVITVTGVLKNYNGTIEFDAGCTLGASEDGGNEGGETTTDPAADSELSVKDAIALGASKEHNTYTEGKYYVSGEITEIYNTQYGNMKIKDAEGNILTVYGTYSADGKDRFDAMAVQPKVGDTVKLYGIIGQYNDTPQMKNGWIVEQPESNGGETGGETGGNDAPSNDVDTPNATSGKASIDFEGTKWYITALDGTWVASSTDAASAGTVKIHLSEDGKFAKIQVGSTYIAPKGGNANGIKEGEYVWAVVKNADGTYKFMGQGEDTVTLAFNSDAQYSKFRAYKNSTVESHPDAYPCNFTIG